MCSNLLIAGAVQLLDKATQVGKSRGLHDIMAEDEDSIEERPRARVLVTRSSSRKPWHIPPCPLVGLKEESKYASLPRWHLIGQQGDPNNQDEGNI